MQRKQLFFSIFAFLCISSSSLAQEAGNSGAVGAAPRLSAALCEMAAWDCAAKPERDSLLLAKAAFLLEAGQGEEAYETVCRISAFGMKDTERQELLRSKLICAWSAGKMDDFQALLSEYEGPLPLPSGKVPLRSEEAAMLLSILPGMGNAYAGDLRNAGKYLLLNSSIIALGVGAFASGLYVSAFLGGGMLLYATLPASTDKAVKAVRERNTQALKSYYAPVYEALSSRNCLRMLSAKVPEPYQEELKTPRIDLYCLHGSYSQVAVVFIPYFAYFWVCNCLRWRLLYLLC